MNKMLVHTVEQGTGRRARIAGRQIAGKTGTTNDHRDAWFVGYVPDLALGVWVGNDESRPMKRITGGTIPAEIFADVMAEALVGRPVAELPQTAKPDDMVRQEKLNIVLFQHAGAGTGGHHDVVMARKSIDRPFGDRDGISPSTLIISWLTTAGLVPGHAYRAAGFLEQRDG